MLTVEPLTPQGRPVADGRPYVSANNKSEKENLTDAELQDLLKSIPK